MPRQSGEALNFSMPDISSYTPHLTERAQSLLRREALVPLTVKMDQTIRAKIIDVCGLTCVFCHNEGTPVNAKQSGIRVSIFEDSNRVDFRPGTMVPGDNFSAAVSLSMREFGAKEIHLTGGEPSLHPDLFSLTESCVNLGFVVKMTSNGETARRIWKGWRDAGGSSVNFSIFGTTPAELAQVQGTRFLDNRKAQLKLKCPSSPTQ